MILDIAYGLTLCAMVVTFCWGIGPLRRRDAHLSADRHHVRVLDRPLVDWEQRKWA